MPTNDSQKSYSMPGKAKWVDSHAHLNFAVFDSDRKEAIKRCLDNGVWMINVGSNLENSRKAAELAGRCGKGVYAAVGLHPINLDTGLIKFKKDRLEGGNRAKEFDYQSYRRLAVSEGVVAIGEVGLDYYWKPKTTRKKKLFKQKQKELLFQELRLAEDLGLPVIFHCRMAHQELIDFLRENENLRPIKAVAHSFVGTREELRGYLDFGFSIGFNGIIFKDIEGVDFEELIADVPIEKMLLETDCPYLAPPSFPNERNEPTAVRYVAERIAQVKKISLEEIARITTQNAKELFSL
jgi:TatD DNase family protein